MTRPRVELVFVTVYKSWCRDASPSLTLCLHLNLSAGSNRSSRWYRCPRTSGTPRASRTQWTIHHWTASKRQTPTHIKWLLPSSRHDRNKSGCYQLLLFQEILLCKHYYTVSYICCQKGRCAEYFKLESTRIKEKKTEFHLFYLPCRVHKEREDRKVTSDNKDHR